MRRLALQALCYGAAAVAVDAGLFEPLRSAAARAARALGGGEGPEAGACPAQPEAAADEESVVRGGGGGDGGGGGGGGGGGIEDPGVFEERSAVEAREGCGAEECSVRAGAVAGCGLCRRPLMGSAVLAPRRRLRRGFLHGPAALPVVPPPGRQARYCHPPIVPHPQLLLDGVRKSYLGGIGEPPVVAVAGLWLRARPGECFGLLVRAGDRGRKGRGGGAGAGAGQSARLDLGRSDNTHKPCPNTHKQGANGAGKTTTFKVVTGEVPPDAGDAFIAGASVLSARSEARRLLGYCPQFDGLPAAMTPGGVWRLQAGFLGTVNPAKPQSSTEVPRRMVSL
jgi:hypothetical protein